GTVPGWSITTSACSTVNRDGCPTSTCRASSTWPRPRKDCHVIGQTAWRCHPGFIGVGVHADYLVMELPEEWLGDPRFTLPPQIGTAHFFLSDITEDLCPTRVIPGSHRSGRYPQKRGEVAWQGRQ